MAPVELEKLVNTLQDRDISLNEDDVAWAFHDPATQDAATSWVREYIQPSTLLTKDELGSLEKRGLRSTATADGISGRMLTDAELEAAISSLDASTAAIDKQCEIMQAQKQALEEIRARNASDDSTTSIKTTRQRKVAREKAQLGLDIEELSHTTQTKLRSSLKQSDAATGNTPSHIERLLEKDDRLLDGLQKLLPKLSDQTEDKDDSRDVERLCSTLTTLSVKEIRGRLDSVYRRTVAEHSNQQNSASIRELSDQQRKQRDTVRAELEELSGEIDGLVSIVIDHQHRKPLKQALLSARSDSQMQKAKWSEYALSAMMYLTARLHAITQHVQHLHFHREALRAVSTTLDTTLVVPQARPGAASSNSSPIFDRSGGGGKGLKPLRLVQANLSEAQDPAIQFLRHHDIRVSEVSSAVKLPEVLELTLAERKAKLTSLSTSTEEGVADAVAGSLGKSEDDLGRLLDAVFAHSEFGGVRLIDAGVQGALDGLEAETQRLGEEMRRLDVEAIARLVKAKEREVVQQLAA